MKNLSRLTALLVACMLLFASLAYAADVGVPMSELDADTYNQMVTNAASSDSNVVIGIGMVNADGVSMNSKWWTAGYTESESLAVLAERTLVDVYEGTYGLPYGILTGEWYKVSYNGQIGYIETKYLDVLEDAVADESGVIVQGMPEGAELVVQTLASDVFGGGFVADISLENWNGEAVTLTLPVSGYADGSSIDVLHFLEDESKISAATPVMNVDSLGSLREALADAMTACKAATGKENCVAVDLSGATVQNGAVTVDVDSFSVFAVDEIAVATYNFYKDAEKTELLSMQYLINGDKLLQPETPSKANCEFLGWKIENTQEYMTFEQAVEVTVDVEVNCYAVFSEPVYNVYFMYSAESNEVMQTFTGVTGDKIDVSLVQYPTSTNKAVVSWHTVSEEKEMTSENQVSGEYVIGSSDVQLWPMVKDVYWLTFDTVGGTIINPIYCAQGEKTEAPGDPTRSGYEFAGWVILGEAEDDEPTKFDFEQPIEKSATLTATWTPKNDTPYTVQIMMQNADGSFAPLLSWEEKGTTESTVGYQAENKEAFLTKLKEVTQTDLHSESDFIVYQEWFELEPPSEATQAVVNGDGSTIVYVRYYRKLVEIQFYLEDDRAVPGWSGNDEPDHTVQGLYMEPLDVSELSSPFAVHDETCDQCAGTAECETGKKLFTDTCGWYWRGTSNNQYKYWELNAVEYSRLPSCWAYTDEREDISLFNRDPYYIIRVVAHDPGSKVGRDKWQLFYFVQALNADKTDVANNAVNGTVANWADLTFVDDDGNQLTYNSEKPSADAYGSSTWDLLEDDTATWQDDEGNKASTVYYQPKKGYTLAAYAFEMFPSETYANDSNKNTRIDYSNKTNGPNGTETHGVRTRIYEVAIGPDQTEPSHWTYMSDTTDGAGGDREAAYDYLRAGEWKYWAGGRYGSDTVDPDRDEEYIFANGKATLSYMRNRGDIYVRLLRNQYTLSFVGKDGKTGDSMDLGAVDLYYEATLNYAEDTEKVGQQTAIAEIIAKLEVPTGYQFAGWYSSADYSGEAWDLEGDDAARMPASNVTLYAKYDRIPVAVTVHHTINGDGKSEGFNLLYGDTVDKANVDAEQKNTGMGENEEWFGWYLRDEDTGLRIPFNFNQQITEDIELYPYYGSTEAYDVNYDSNTEDKTVVAPQDEYKYFTGSAAVIPGGEEMAVEGKSFLGWNTAPDGSGTTYLPGEIVPITGDTIFYAIWGDAPGMVTLTYHENFEDSEQTHAVQMQVNSTHTVLDVTNEDMNYSHLGYMFVGWNTEPDGSGTTHQPEAEIVVTQDETNGTNDLYAIWQPLYGSLTITKEADVSLDPNQSFIFEVTQKTNTTTEKLDSPIKVVINGSGSVTIEHLPLGTYSVKELTDWSWRYDVEDDDTKTTSIVASKVVSDGQMTIENGEVTFKNTRSTERVKWLDGQNFKENHFDGTQNTTQGS